MSKGLLVMHYGTPASLDDVLPYYTHIRRGRAPEQEQLADLVSRYEAIGGPSPLNDVSKRQAERIRSGLAARGWDSRLFIGSKHATPFIGDAVRQMAQEGIEEAIGIVLAPHYSMFSVESYTKEAFAVRDEVAPQMKLAVLQRWGAMPAFVQALADRVGRAIEGFDPKETLVIFSAHSLPERILAAGDRYKEELWETSRLVSAASGVPHWTFAFQSASNTGEPWLGPDILDVIKEGAREYRNIVACTVGFVSDHLEVLYDLGIEARVKCEELGLGFSRAECINDDPVVMDQLAQEAISLVSAGHPG